MDCSICLSSISATEDKVSLGCSHQYHLSCLFQNIATFETNSNKCPMCRKQMDIDLEKHNKKQTLTNRALNSYKYKQELIIDELQDICEDDKINAYAKKRIKRDVLMML